MRSPHDSWILATLGASNRTQTATVMHQPCLAHAVCAATAVEWRLRVMPTPVAAEGRVHCCSTSRRSRRFRFWARIGPGRAACNSRSAGPNLSWRPGSV